MPTGRAEVEQKGKMKNRKKDDGRKGRGVMAVVDDLYRRRLLGTNAGR